MTPNLKQQQEILQQYQANFDKLSTEYTRLFDENGGLKYPFQFAALQRRIDASVMLLNQQNLVKCLENNGNFMDVSDKMGNEFKNVPDFSEIDSTNIFFEDNILEAKMPNYIPYIDELDYLSNGCVLDAVEILPSKYLLATRKYNFYFSMLNKQHFYYNENGQKIEKPLRDHVIDNSFIVINLDQLVLIDDYYYKRALLVEKKRVEAWNKESKERYFKNAAMAHRELSVDYSRVPKVVQKKYDRATWNQFSLEEKEKIYLPISIEKPKKIAKTFNRSLPWSFCIMYSNFIDIKEFPTKKARGKGYLVSHKLADEFRKLLKFIEDRTADIEQERRDFTESHQKGFETSFGRSNTDKTLLKDYGVLVKRQDGTVIKFNDIEQIKTSLDIVQKWIFPIAEQARKDSMVISHAAKTSMFARRAAGLFVPSVPTIGITNKYGEKAFVDILAHEMAHYIDRTLGKAKGLRYLTDDYTTDAYDLAREFRLSMNQYSRSVYLNSDKECLARAFQQYVAVNEYGEMAFVKVSSEFDVESDHELLNAKTFYQHDNFVGKDKFETRIVPLIEQFIKKYAYVFSGLTQEGYLKQQFKLHAEKALI